jgi:hypothetical protein
LFYEYEEEMTKGGGLLQLVAVGKQDVYLTGNPSISWFKAVYRRHTNFAVESKRMYFDGSPDFGQRFTCLIPRAGDLLGPLFLEIELPAVYFTDGSGAAYVNGIGHALIKEISIQVGEQEIDKQTGEYMHLNYLLSTSANKLPAYRTMIGETEGYEVAGISGPVSLIVPLHFWFNKSPGSYLPLLALQYHPIRINIQLRPLKELIYYSGSDHPVACNDNLPLAPAHITSFNMWGDYVYLDVLERRRFVSTPIEYLITQVQWTPRNLIPYSAVAASIDLNFNHPLKELIWVLQRSAAADKNQIFNYSNMALGEVSPNGVRTDLYTDATLQLDSEDRFEKRGAKYFRIVQPYQHHTNIPYLNFINNYCFALNPEDSQPSGSLNASRIDNIKLNLTMNNTVGDYVGGLRGDTYCVVYAVNVNVFRVVDGFGGVLFSV